MSNFGIKSIGAYIPESRISNEGLSQKFDLRDGFIESKIGVTERAIRQEGESVVDMCEKAFNNLKDVSIDEIEVIILVTQNPDFLIPHNSAMVHERLKAGAHCVCFDISQGCSGFVYGLSVITSFMKSNGFKKGLLFTCDPYSKVVNPDDKATALIFGDAASVSLITDEDYYFRPGLFDFGSVPQSSMAGNSKSKTLSMNGRQIFNLAAKNVPESFKRTLEKNDLTQEEIDYYVFHQGSKYIVDAVSGRLGCDKDKVVFDIEKYGNTVSSTIPLILSRHCLSNKYDRIFISGFGIGLSWGSTVLFREE